MTRSSFLRPMLGALGLSAFVLIACGDDEAFGCGENLTCEAGQLCVEMQAWTTEFRCVENPCGDEPTSCECAASACDFGECGGVEDTKVTCFCPTC
jgi:hypothetical protein